MASGQRRSARRMLTRARARARSLRGAAAPARGAGARGDGRVALLLDSPLFDAEWYALRTGAQGDREALVRHYLATPREKRVSPQPLFDPAWFARCSKLDLTGKDPFLVYLRRKPFGTPTHPAFSTVHYRRTVEGAKEHPHGPLGHYLEVGAPDGIPGNRWLPVDAEGHGVDLRAWLLERHRALAAQAEAEALPVVPRRALKAVPELDAALAADVADVVVDVVLTPAGAPSTCVRAWRGWSPRPTAPGASSCSTTRPTPTCWPPSRPSPPPSGRPASTSPGCRAVRCCPRPRAGSGGVRRLPHRRR
ncbi:hypothetical protein [Nocardioides daphniae]|uniref:Uncharacterized protein n=1 Tax=Nocardioides daphniae TaxID=402297 RepID=A0A4P7U9Z9_9ACTN|nr:hypothetical protein [Nocardioides daphniae]QCC76902.1 hypothetical protein E2C04_06125 [Nocardioides daphniae]